MTESKFHMYLNFNCIISIRHAKDFHKLVESIQTIKTNTRNYLDIPNSYRLYFKTLEFTMKIFLASLKGSWKSATLQPATPSSTRGTTISPRRWTSTGPACIIATGWVSSYSQYWPLLLIPIVFKCIDLVRACGGMRIRQHKIGQKSSVIPRGIYFA